LSRRVSSSTRTASFQTSFRYRGPDLESSTEELVAVSARVNNVLRRFGSGWALFFEAVRRERRMLSAKTIFADAASWLVDEERAAAADEAGARFESDYYLTLLWLPPPDAEGRAEQRWSSARPARRRRLAPGPRAVRSMPRGQVFDLLDGTLPRSRRSGMTRR
jgi:type IV secretion system protein TrbE